MYIEKRKSRNDIKYYLIHSYREQDKINKIRKYLGRNLKPDELAKARKNAEKVVLETIRSMDTEVFLFSLTKKQVEHINRYEQRVQIAHLDDADWQRFTESFVYNTNAIEGSTVQKDDVPGILRRERVENSEEIETKGVAKAVAYIRNTKEELSIDLIKKLHKLCFEGSKHFAGEFRKVEVVIKGPDGEIAHYGAPSSLVELSLQNMISWYYKNKKIFKPLVLAAIIHNQFEHIHPFQDGNGRVGRLLLNLILIKNNYPPINIKFEDRAKYYQTLQEYSKNHDIKPTLKFLIKIYNKSLKKVTTKNKK